MHLEAWDLDSFERDPATTPICVDAPEAAPEELNK
jgi:hypothetical protein